MYYSHHKGCEKINIWMPEIRLKFGVGNFASVALILVTNESMRECPPVVITTCNTYFITMWTSVEVKRKGTAT